MDKYSREVRSRMMSAIRSTGNRSTELRLRALLIRAGIKGWKVNARDVHGHPDFVFPHARVAVFVDGAFWHGAPGFDRYPKTNKAFWKEKIERNRQRDAHVTHILRRRGWCVLRFWDYQLKQNPSMVVAKIRKRVNQRLGSRGAWMEN